MKHAAYAATGALALALSACGGGDDADRERPATQVTEQEAESGLAAMGLEEGGRARWDERTEDDGVYVFTNFVLPIEADDADGGEPDEAAVFSAERFEIAAPRVEDGAPMFDRVAMTGVESTAEDGVVTIDSLLVDRPGPELARAVAAGFTGEEDADVFSDFSELANYRFDALSVEGLTSRGQGDDGERFEASLDSLGANDFDGERMESFLLDTFAVRVSEAESEGADTLTMSLDSLSFEGLGAAFFQSIAASLEDGDAEAPGLMNTFNPADMYERFAMEGLDVDAQGVLVAMPAVTAEVEDRGGEIWSVFEMPELTLDADAAREGGARLAEALAMLEYDSLRMSARGESVYDVDADRARTEGENYLEIADAARIDFEQDFGGVQAYTDRYMQAVADGEMEDGELPPEVFEPLVIHSLAMRLEDRSLLERGLTAAGAQQGMSAEDMRAQAAALVAMGLMAAPAELPRPLLAQISEAMTGFIQQGGTLSVRMDPETPVSVGEIMQAGPENIDFDALGLEVANEPAEQD